MTDTEREQLRKAAQSALDGEAQDAFITLATPAAVLDLFASIEGLSRALVATVKRR